MKRAAAVGILGFVLLHSCTVASPEPYRSWKTYDGNMATAIRRSLTQAPNHEALAAKETFTLPHQCKIVQSNTTSECFRTCMTCQLTHRNPDMRPCTCCKAGYHPIAKVGRCWVCPLGTFSGPGQSECTACPTGLSTVSHGSSVCNACQAGYEVDEQNPGSCQPCPPGSIRRQRIAMSRQPRCTPCPTGRTTVGTNRTRCSGCLPGYAGASCRLCPLGTYSTGGDATRDNQCIRCPVGTTTPQPGSTSAAACAGSPSSPSLDPTLIQATANVTVRASGSCSTSACDALIAPIKKVVLEHTPAKDQPSVQVTRSLTDCSVNSPTSTRVSLKAASCSCNACFRSVSPSISCRSNATDGVTVAVVPLGPPLPPTPAPPPAAPQLPTPVPVADPTPPTINLPVPHPEPHPPSPVPSPSPSLQVAPDWRKVDAGVNLELTHSVCDQSTAEVLARLTQDVFQNHALPNATVTVEQGQCAVVGGRARYVMPVKTIGPDYNTVGSTWSKVATFFEGVTYEDNVNGGLTSTNLTGSPQIFKKGFEDKITTGLTPAPVPSSSPAVSDSPAPGSSPDIPAESSPSPSSPLDSPATTSPALVPSPSQSPSPAPSWMKVDAGVNVELTHSVCDQSTAEVLARLTQDVFQNHALPNAMVTVEQGQCAVVGGRARYVMPVKTIGPDYNTVGSTWSKVATFFEGVTYEDNVNGGLTSANLTGSPQIFKKGFEDKITTGLTPAPVPSSSPAVSDSPAPGSSPSPLLDDPSASPGVPSPSPIPVTTVGPEGGTYPYEVADFWWLCPEGAKVSAIAGRAGFYVDALGPITCSDGNKVGNMVGGGAVEDEFLLESATGFTGVDVRSGWYLDKFQVQPLGIWVGHDDADIQPSMNCPAGTYIAGLFGTYWENTYIIRVGLLCR